MNDWTSVVYVICSVVSGANPFTAAAALCRSKERSEEGYFFVGPRLNL